MALDILKNYFYASVGSILVVHLIANFFPIPVFVQLFISSCATIMIGCITSINLSSLKGIKDENEKQAEVMQAKDAYMFPVYGSAVLFGLYVLFKFIDKSLLSSLFNVYFSVLGLLCLMGLLEDIFQPYLPELRKKIVFKVNYDLPFLKIIKCDKIEFDVNQMNVLTFAVAIIPTVYYFLTKNWITNNIFGIAFSISGIQSIILPDFKIGFILLWGLFFYDIFWVYGTDVMVTVAKSLDAPIKLLFPIDFSTTPPKFSMLGLGDIVIPGIFVALCLKFDIDRSLLKDKLIQNIKTPYYLVCFTGYALGIISTFVTMVVFNHAQPALLFLVPGCTLSILFLALFKGEVKNLVEYYDERKDQQQNQQQQVTDDGNEKKAE